MADREPMDDQTNKPADGGSLDLRRSETSVSEGESDDGRNAQRDRTSRSRPRRRPLIWIAVVAAIVVLGIGAYGALQAPGILQPWAATEQPGTPAAVADAEFQVGVNATVESGLPLELGSRQAPVVVAPDQRRRFSFSISNPSQRAVSMYSRMAVRPADAARYVKLVDCFCYVDTTLRSGESQALKAELYVDSAILKDPAVSDLRKLEVTFTVGRPAP